MSGAAVQHVVWDWNGTLLDDFLVAVEAAGVACRRLAGIDVTEAVYRRHYTRPVRYFYENLLGRPLAEPEWQRVVVDFHDHYLAALPTAQLRPEAAEVLALVHRLGATQSLLSMGAHDELLPQLNRHRIGHWFLLAQGSKPAERTESKQRLLHNHLAEVSRLRGAPVPPEAVLMVGDTMDDATAAHDIGVRCVLLDDGLYDPAALAALGFGSTPDLRAAVST